MAGELQDDRERRAVRTHAAARSLKPSLRWKGFSLADFAFFSLVLLFQVLPVFHARLPLDEAIVDAKPCCRVCCLSQHACREPEEIGRELRTVGEQGQHNTMEMPQGGGGSWPPLARLPPDWCIVERTHAPRIEAKRTLILDDLRHRLEKAQRLDTFSFHCIGRRM